MCCSTRISLGGGELNLSFILFCTQSNSLPTPRLSSKHISNSSEARSRPISAAVAAILGPSVTSLDSFQDDRSLNKSINHNCVRQEESYNNRSSINQHQTDSYTNNHNIHLDYQHPDDNNILRPVYNSDDDTGSLDSLSICPSLTQANLNLQEQNQNNRNDALNSYDDKVDLSSLGRCPNSHFIS